MNFHRRAISGWLIGLIVYLAVLSFSSGAVEAVQQEHNTIVNFTDLVASNPDIPYVTYLTSKGIFTGYPDGGFHPGEALTRAQAAVIVVKTAGINQAANSITPFKDVPKNHWAQAYIAAAVKAGYIKGFPDGSYHPDAKLSRAQGIALLLKLSSQNQTSAPLPLLNDVNSQHWAASDIATGIASGMVGLTSDGQCYLPDAPFTRINLAHALGILLTQDPNYYKSSLESKLKPLNGKITFLKAGQENSQEIKAETILAAGDIIQTMENSSAELDYPDGSSILLQANTRVEIKEARGRKYIKVNGQEGIAVDWLNLDLKKGTVFAALATKHEGENNTEKIEEPNDKKISQPSNQAPKFLASLTGHDYLATAANQTARQEMPWYEAAKTKKVKVQVDMPWGVAAVRGTFIKATVNADGSCIVSCLTGSAEVSGSSSSIPLGSGQSSGISNPGSSPGQAAPMSQQDKQDFNKAQDWVVNTALNMDVNQEAKIAPAVVIEVEIPNAKSGEQPVQETATEQKSEAKTQENKTEQQQATEKVETAVKAVLDALKASGIELKQEVIENLKQQVQEIQTQVEKQTADALQTQVTQAQAQTSNSSTTPTTSSSSNSSSSSSSIQSITYTTAGTYGPVNSAVPETINGNVIITAAGVTLQNVNIIGSLTLSEGIGEGEVTLNNLKVQGNTNINGGGSASVHVINCQINTVTITKENHQIRIIVQGETNIGTLTLNSGATLEESGLSATAGGFSSVLTGSVMPAGTNIIMYGSFISLNINAADLNIQLNRGSLDEVYISGAAADTNLNLAEGTSVQRLTANAAAIFSGAGQIASVTINAAGVHMAQIPSNIHFTNGIIAVIAGQIVNAGSLLSGTGAIGGWVINSAGQGISGASIMVRAGTNSSSSVSSTGGGSFIITGLNPGIYSLEVSSPTVGTAYSSSIINNLAVTGGQITMVKPAIQMTTASPPVPATPTIPTPPVLANNAQLSHLSLTDISNNPIILVPLFTPNILNYSANVAESVYSINISPSVADPGATWKVNGSTLSLGAATALVNLQPGSNAVNIEVTAQDASTRQTYTIAVNQLFNSIICPAVSNFDKKNSARSDVIITVNLISNALLSITNGSATLQPGTDYTVSGNVVTIKQDYLALQDPGTTTLTFNFSAGANQALTITVVDTTPQYTTINWKGGDGAWANAGNWDLNRLPVSGDHVVINSGTVTFSVGTTDIACINCTSNLVISGGTLNMNDTVNPSSVNNLTLSGGTLGGSGNLTIIGTCNWSSGSMTGTGTTIIQTGAVLNINEGASNYLLRTLQNDGIVNLNSSNFRYHGSEGMTITNNGVFDIKGDYCIGIYSYSGENYSARGVFNNNAGATLKKSGGTGATVIEASLNNAGTVRIEENCGTFEPRCVVNSAGSFSLGSGSTLILSVGINLNTGGEIIGPGTLLISGGTANFNTAMNLNTLNIIGGIANFNNPSTIVNLTLSGGTLGGSGNLTIIGTCNWSSGSMTGTGTTIIQTGAVLNINEGASNYLLRTLQNDGIVNLNSSNFRYHGSEGMTITNNGVFDIKGDYCIGIYSYSGENYSARGVFNNNAGATLKKSGGTGTAVIEGTFNNNGTVLVGPNGSIKLTGDFNQGSSGILEFDVGSITQGVGYNQLQVTGTATLNGGLNINLVNAYVPSVGDNYTVMTYGTKTGNFNSIDNNQGHTFTPQYNGATFILTAGN